MTGAPEIKLGLAADKAATDKAATNTAEKRNHDIIIWLGFSIFFSILFVFVLFYPLIPGIEHMRNISNSLIQHPYMLSNQTIIRNQSLNTPSTLKSHAYSSNYTITKQLFYGNQTPFINEEKALVFSSIILSIIGILLFVSLTRLFKTIERRSEIDKESEDFKNNLILYLAKKHPRLLVDDKSLKDLLSELNSMQSIMHSALTLSIMHRNIIRSHREILFDKNNTIP
jgi:hypothetical protein